MLATPSLAKPPVWIVRDADSEMVLFGSVHVLPPGLDWQPETLKRGLVAADDIWFELHPNQEGDNTIAQLAASRGTLPPHLSLLSLLSSRDRARLVRACQRFGFAPGLLDRLEPWYAEVTLASAAFREAGASAEAGVENVLEEQTPKTAHRVALETAEQQIEMLAGAPRSDQLASLRMSLRELDHDPKAYDNLERAWMAADIGQMHQDAIRPLALASPEIYRRLVSERNRKWSQALDLRLKGHGKTVVVVGVGHLIGPEGVPAQLRALGYSVEGP